MRIKIALPSTDVFPPLGKVVDNEHFVPFPEANDYKGSIVYLDRRHAPILYRVMSKLLLNITEVDGKLDAKTSENDVGIKHYVFRLYNLTIIEKILWETKG